MKLIKIVMTLAVAGVLASCKDKDPAPSANTGGAAAENGPTCSTGAGAARTKAMTGGEEDPAKATATDGTEPAQPGGSRLKGSEGGAPSKVTTTGETDPVPGSGKDVEFEVKTKERDDATREALDKILDKAPATKP